jgi:regulator of nucleoside diphosphate kinase
MNSRVRLKNLESGEEMIQTLVFPHGANPAQGRVSILTSLETAMLGRRVGDFMEFGVSDGAKRFHVESVLFQPEAANEDDW